MNAYNFIVFIKKLTLLKVILLVLNHAKQKIKVSLTSVTHFLKGDFCSFLAFVLLYFLNEKYMSTHVIKH